VDKQQTTEENLKTIIYGIYTHLFSEIASDQRQVYIGQIWDKIVLWWNKFNCHKIDAKEMGEEIFNVIKRLVKENNEIVKNKSEFFYILKKSMENAENEYFRKGEQDSIKISREEKHKLKELNDLIKMREDFWERKLTNDEKEQCISKWFKKQEYIDLLNAKNVGSLYPDNDETGGLNYVDPHSNDPLDEYINKTDMENVLEAVTEAVTSVLDKKHEKVRPCIKALFTLYCINNNLRGLYPILDQEIIDSFLLYDKKPNQYEIYQKYHPETDKESAGSEASTNLHAFLKDVKKCLKGKKSIIFP